MNRILFMAVVMFLALIGLSYVLHVLMYALYFSAIITVIILVYYFNKNIIK